MNTTPTTTVTTRPDLADLVVHYVIWVHVEPPHDDGQPDTVAVVGGVRIHDPEKAGFDLVEDNNLFVGPEHRYHYTSTLEDDDVGTETLRLKSRIEEDLADDIETAKAAMEKYAGRPLEWGDWGPPWGTDMADWLQIDVEYAWNIAEADGPMADHG